MIDVKKSEQEVRDALAKHENYLRLIKDDEEFKRDEWGSAKKISWQWK